MRYDITLNTTRWVILSLFSMLTLSPLSAQTDSLLMRDYTFVKQADMWLTSQNAAALQRFAMPAMAQAQLALSASDGAFVNYYEAPRSLQADAAIESFYRYSPRTVFYGRVAYQNFSGRQMAGSAFINPQRQPFDIVEDSLTNQGDKHRDIYALTGAFSTLLTSRIAVGARLDYTAANYAKYKDLRHKNKLMDLQLAAGLYAPIEGVASVGAHYLYHRNTESITFGTYGTSDKVYKSMVSYANFTGQLEQFGSEGFTDKSREMPLVTNYNGVSLQLSSDENDGLLPFGIYAAYSYTHGSGYYGRKSPYTITYTDHTTDSHQLQARLSYRPSDAALLFVDFSMNIQQLQNDINTYRELKNEAGATYYEYYTPTKAADKTWQDYSLSATLFWGLQQQLPTWTVKTGVDWNKRRQTAYLFPYLRRQQLHSEQVYAMLSRNIIGKRGVWTLTADAAFQNGGGQPYEDATLQAPSDKQPQPASMDAYLWREYQYLTAAQLALGATVRYSFIIPSTRLKTFAQVGIAHRKANEQNTFSAGRRHTAVTLAIGCEF